MENLEKVNLENNGIVQELATVFHEQFSTKP